MAPGRVIIIFVRSDHGLLAHFFSHHHPAIPAPYVLVTGTTDQCSVPQFAFKHLDDPKV
jgi:hypothetical protein